MNETYRCLDGREVVLTFDEDALRVEATSRGGETIGTFQFGLVGQRRRDRPAGRPRRCGVAGSDSGRSGRCVARARH
ncbi:MAG: hypothetical protein JWO24_4039 [Rhodospirillales bacterium]|nr:hypothetical protein [Rhodospirillales bacterium]